MSHALVIQTLLYSCCLPPPDWQRSTELCRGCCCPSSLPRKGPLARNRRLARPSEPVAKGQQRSSPTRGKRAAACTCHTSDQAPAAEPRWMQQPKHLPGRSCRGLRGAAGGRDGGAGGSTNYKPGKLDPLLQANRPKFQVTPSFAVALPDVKCDQGQCFSLTCVEPYGEYGTGAVESTAAPRPADQAAPPVQGWARAAALPGAARGAQRLCSAPGREERRPARPQLG